MRVFWWDEIVKSNVDSDFFKGGTALSVGSFDGPHLGHKMLFDALFDASSRKNLLSGVVTFKRPLPFLKHPYEYRGDIATLEQRLDEFEKLSLDFCVIADFSSEFRDMSGENFLSVLKNIFCMKFIAEGQDFHFGYKGQSKVEDVKSFCLANRIECAFPDFVYFEGKRISSSAIRQKICEGNFEEVPQLLGREFSLDLRSVQAEDVDGAGVKTREGEKFYAREKITQVLPEHGKFKIDINGSVKEIELVKDGVVVQ